MKNLIIIYLLLTLASSCYTTVKPEIFQFTTYTKEVDSFISLDKMLVIYNYFFLVKNYTSKKETKSEIDSFAVEFFKNGKFSPNREEVRVHFYKETSKTNMESIKANPREVDRYSNQHDLVLDYTFLRNNYIKKEKIKNGDVVETNLKPIVPIPEFRIKKIE